MKIWVGKFPNTFAPTKKQQGVQTGRTPKFQKLDGIRLPHGKVLNYGKDTFQSTQTFYSYR
jgi:hypothetical protein